MEFRIKGTVCTLEWSAHCNLKSHWTRFYAIRIMISNIYNVSLALMYRCDSKNGCSLEIRSTNIPEYGCICESRADTLNLNTSLFQNSRLLNKYFINTVANIKELGAAKQKQDFFHRFVLLQICIFRNLRKKLSLCHKL